MVGKAAVVADRGAKRSQPRSHRGIGDGMSVQGDRRNTGDPARWMRDQLDAREEQARPPGESERSIVPWKPGNAGGGKGPQFKANVRSGMTAGEIGDEPTTPDKG